MNRVKIPVIIGDIGGTNSRLSIIKMSSDIDDEPEIVDNQTLVSFQYESLESLLKTYLSPFKDTSNYPLYGAIGFPSPVFQNKIQKPTNIPHWNGADGDEIAKHLNIPKLQFVNDFVMNGYAVQSKLVESKDYSFVNNKRINPNGPKALFGPGTGVGYGLLFKPADSIYYKVLPSEGAHQDFAPKTDLEFKYMLYLKQLYHIDHVSIERASCGLSICPMYKFLLEHYKVEPEPNLKEKILRLENITSNDEELVRINKEIFDKGLEKKCPLCRKVIEFFVGLLGNAAGNLSILTCCTGGIYLLGGISISLEKVLVEENIFMKHFVDKGRFKKFLESIPVMIVKDKNFGMRGAKEFARRLIEEDEK